MITHRARSAFRKEVKMRNKTRDLIGLTLVCTFIINGQKLQGRGDTIEEAREDAVKNAKKEEGTREHVTEK